MNYSLKQEVQIAGQKAQYDEHAKRILAQKIILAHILSSCVSEFKGVSPEEIADLIEEEPKVSEISILPGESNWQGNSGVKPVITGENTESSVPYEGMITYDIRVSVWTPDRRMKIKLLVDIEAQKDFYPGYHLAPRGIFYASRMISSQVNTEFEIPHYDEIKKVYSIWICMNAPVRVQNTITEFCFDKKDRIGRSDGLGNYDLMGVIFVALGKEIAEAEEGLELHRLLGALFSPSLTEKRKQEILEKEYNISMSKDMERRVGQMCNLSEAIEERGIEKGIEKGSERILALIDAMSSDGRTAEIPRLKNEPEFLRAMLKKYEIQ